MTTVLPGITGAAAAVASVDLLVFALESERFAVRARGVFEAVRAVAVSALPDAPAVVAGAINYRGRIVPVIDARRLCGFPSRTIDPAHHFIVVEAGRRVVALWVDRVLELASVAADAILSPTQAAPGARYTEGVARLPDGLLVIHDVERFLSLDEGRDLDAALVKQQVADRGGGA